MQPQCPLLDNPSICAVFCLSGYCLFVFPLISWSTIGRSKALRLRTNHINRGDSTAGDNCLATLSHSVRLWAQSILIIGACSSKLNLCKAFPVQTTAAVHCWIVEFPFQFDEASPLECCTKEKL